MSKYAWYGALAFHLAIVAVFWWQGSGALLFQDFASAMISLGRLLGLLAATSVLLQFALMGRNVYLERTFGLDRLSRFHHITGLTTIGFVLAHPIFLIVGYAQLSGISLWSQFLSFLLGYEHVLWAFFGLLLFVIVVATSITIVRSKVRYEAWYVVHLIVYLATFLSFFHQHDVGTDLLISRFFNAYWIFLYGLVMSSQLVFRFARPVWRLWKCQFRVEKIVRENYNVVSIYITGRNLAQFPVVSGQFMIFRFLAKGFWWQAHPFSLSCWPNGKQLRITVKAVGDFTDMIPDLPVGTKVLIDGPYGIFTEWVCTREKIFFLAGGIGITPVRSLMEQFLHQGKDGMLLYANKTERDIVFKQELEGLEKKYGARVVEVLSDQAGYAGEKGFIDAEKIQRLVPDFREREVYLCGPPPMMTALVATLTKLGVAKNHIHFEKFELG